MADAIVFSGNIGVGKTTAARYIADRGAEYFEMSNIPREQYSGFNQERAGFSPEGVSHHEWLGHVSDYLEKTEQKSTLAELDLSQFAGVMKNHVYGSRWPANLLAERIEGETAAVSGIRTPEEVHEFRNQLEDVYHIHLKADPEERFSRIQERESSEYTQEEFDDRNRRERSWGLDEIEGQKVYDCILDNTDMPVERFQTRIDELTQVGLEDGFND
jgi:dephospho-CoA kinase